jgi:hypothetical protein
MGCQQPPVVGLTLTFNRGFQQALEGLAALRQYPAFQARELDRCAALTKETRAVINSYLASIIEDAETTAAGRRYRKRRLQEKKEEQRT